MKPCAWKKKKNFFAYYAYDMILNKIGRLINLYGPKSTCVSCPCLFQNPTVSILFNRIVNPIANILGLVGVEISFPT